MAARDGLFEELEHVLQDLDARVEQVDPLWNLEVAPRGVVERLQVRICLSCRAGSVRERPRGGRGGLTQNTSCGGRRGRGQPEGDVWVNN